VPTSSSWLNLVESVFADLTKRRPRRGTFPSLDHVVAAIIDYLDHRNQDPKPFVGTASVQSILAKLRGCMPITEDVPIHQMTRVDRTRTISPPNPGRSPLP